MGWQLLQNDTHNGDPIQAYYRDLLCDEIRKYFEQLDRVVIMWRRNNHWMPTPLGLAMPKGNERKHCDPQDGANQLVDLAFGYATENSANYIRFDGLGSSSRGDTAKLLFKLQIRPFDNPEDDDRDGKNGKAKIHDGIADSLRVVTETLDKMGTQLSKSYDREIGLADKVIEIAKTTNANTEQVVAGIRAMADMEKDKYAHDENIEGMKRTSEMFDRFMGEFGPGTARVFEDWLRQTAGLSDDVLKGPFASRLRAIWKGLTDEQKGQLKTELGQDSADVLGAMLEAKDDQQFSTLGTKFVDTLGEQTKDKRAKLQVLAKIIGVQRATAFVKLLVDAGIVDGP